MTYEKALEELQHIFAAIENEAVSIDELSAKTKRASELIQFCKNKLRDVEQEVGQQQS